MVSLTVGNKYKLADRNFCEVNIIPLTDLFHVQVYACS